MSIAIVELDRLTERRWPMLVGRDCASTLPAIAGLAERLVASAGLRAGDGVLDVASAAGNAAIAAVVR